MADNKSSLLTEDNLQLSSLDHVLPTETLMIAIQPDRARFEAGFASFLLSSHVLKCAGGIEQKRGGHALLIAFPL